MAGSTALSAVPYAISWHPCTTDRRTTVSITFLFTTIKAGAGKVLVQDIKIKY
jgi:hypothetical protein